MKNKYDFEITNEKDVAEVIKWRIEDGWKIKNIFHYDKEIYHHQLVKFGNVVTESVVIIIFKMKIKKYEERLKPPTSLEKERLLQHALEMEQKLNN